MHMTDPAVPSDEPRGALENAALSDIGLRRGNNQDSFAVALSADEGDWRRRGHLFMVADGMGAHAAGELASKMACESIPHTYRKLLDRSPAEALREAVSAANATIHERGQANAEFQGMGTTCSTLVLLPNVAIAAHVGDSRVYRLRGSKLEQLTFDHSLVWEMMAAGQMPKGDVANFIPKNIITRSLGPHADVQVDVEGPFPLEPGDTFLLCSDGLSGQVEDDEIGSMLATLTPAEAVRTLVDVANLRGGPDNITVIVARVNSVPVPQAAPELISRNEPPVNAAHPALWGLTALCLVVALGLAAKGMLIPALVALLVGVVSAVVALVQNLSAAPATNPQPSEGPLGTGPHATFEGLPSVTTATALAQLAQQLREATKTEHWTLDWSRFNTLVEQAQAAQTAGDITSAVRHFALAISFMMNEIRRQPVRKDHRDNSVLDT